MADQKLRFMDKIDRLYVATDAFDTSFLFSDNIIENTNGIIGVIDIKTVDPVPQYITNEKRLKLFWRTFVQDVPKDPDSTGFRVLIYPSGRL